MTGEVSREHWLVPVGELTGADPDASVRLVACRDGTVNLHLTGSGAPVGIRLDVSRAAQLSTGIWEAAGVAQQLTTDPCDAGDGQPVPPRSVPTAAEAQPVAWRSQPRRSVHSRNSSPGPRRRSASGNEGAAMDAEEARTIGRRLRRIRDSRSKSLRVIAGLAGTSATTLHRIERGQRPLTFAELVTLADALQVAPSELTRLPVPAPANGHTDSSTEAIRLALDAVEAGYPGGLEVPVAVLRDRVVQLHAQRRACQFVEVATGLPGLIRDLHTALATGADHAELLELAVYLHVHVTRLWLAHTAAPVDLLRRVVFLARRLAQERDDLTTLAMAGFAVTDTLLHAGAFELGRVQLDSLTLPPTTAGTAGLVCYLTATHAEAAALQGRPGDIDAPMDAAAEMGERFGENDNVDSLGFLWVHNDVGAYRMSFALEAGEPDRAVSIAQDINPERHPVPKGRADYWIHYGRALARLRGRYDDAVRALRTAEDIFPARVRRDPMVRDVIAALLTRVRRDAVGQELRRMAHRAGVPE